MTSDDPVVAAFTEGAILDHIARHHPLCPEGVRQALVQRIVQRAWGDLPLGRVVGIAATNHVRHELTDYERLLNIPRLRRDEARLIIRSEVADIIAAWGGAKKTSNPEERAAKVARRNRRRNLRRKRAKARAKQRAAALASSD